MRPPLAAPLKPGAHKSYNKALCKRALSSRSRSLSSSFANRQSRGSEHAYYDSHDDQADLSKTLHQKFLSSTLDDRCKVWTDSPIVPAALVVSDLPLPGSPPQEKLDVRPPAVSSPSSSDALLSFVPACVTDGHPTLFDYQPSTHDAVWSPFSQFSFRDLSSPVPAADDLQEDSMTVTQERILQQQLTDELCGVPNLPHVIHGSHLTSENASQLPALSELRVTDGHNFMPSSTDSIASANPYRLSHAGPPSAPSRLLPLPQNVTDGQSRLLTSLPPTVMVTASTLELPTAPDHSKFLPPSTQRSQIPTLKHKSSSN